GQGRVAAGGFVQMVQQVVLVQFTLDVNALIVKPGRQRCAGAAGQDGRYTGWQLPGQAQRYEPRCRRGGFVQAVNEDDHRLTFRGLSDRSGAGRGGGVLQDGLEPGWRVVLGREYPVGSGVLQAPVADHLGGEVAPRGLRRRVIGHLRDMGGPGTSERQIGSDGALAHPGLGLDHQVPAGTTGGALGDEPVDTLDQPLPAGKQPHRVVRIVRVLQAQLQGQPFQADYLPAQLSKRADQIIDHTVVYPDGWSIGRGY